jgi:hypothetical protein
LKIEQKLEAKQPASLKKHGKIERKKRLMKTETIVKTEK